MTQQNKPTTFSSFEPGIEITDEQLETRVNQLLAELTLDEKLGLMDADTPFWPGMVEMMGGGYADHTWNAGVVPRLNIPGIRFADGPRGLVMEGGTTFPVSMARGASWDPALEERIGEIIGYELRAKGGTLFGGVCINLLRHPAWGRAQETYGEDPYLLGEMGAALTRGVQKHAMACAKHYALNSIENARFKVDVTISPRALHEIYLPHFKRAVDEGVAAIMSAYNSVNGEWCGQNKTLLTDILKEQWGFDGFVLTDFIWGMRDAHKAALAGQDLEMPFQMHYHQHLKELVESGQVPLEKIDQAVSRSLRQQFRLLRSASYDPDQVGCESFRAVAREAAQKSIVLLQNEGSLLPLGGFQKIAVIGRLADMPNTGDDGSSNTRPAYVITPLQGLQKALDGQAEVLFEDGTDLERAKKLAQQADVVLLVVGYDHKDEGEFLDQDTKANLAKLYPTPNPDEVTLAQEYMQSLGKESDGEFLSGGDRGSLTLHKEDENLIQEIAAINPRTIVAVMGGSGIIMENWRQQVPAILILWYPGMEGGLALADVLLGKVNPSGKLPFAIPTHADHLPLFDRDATKIEYDLWHGYRKLARDGHTPAFPFGFGLSYTQYQYANLELAKDWLDPSETLQVSLELTNSGPQAGDEIVQLYITTIGSSIERAPIELKAFTRTSLQPGETKRVHLDVPVSRLAYYDETSAKFVVEALEYQVSVGAHSADEQALKARFHILAGD
ncbi:MAG: beta-glucosidase [Anaerolineales bacterium]